MALEDAKLLAIEELKETGHEIRYREQLMVQEFSLSMVATGVVVGVVTNSDPRFGIVVQLFGLFFLGFLTLHLRNLNQDRRAAIEVKEQLRKKLGFNLINQNVGGLRPWPAVSSPGLMVRFAAILTIAWFAWTCGDAIHLLK